MFDEILRIYTYLVDKNSTDKNDELTNVSNSFDYTDYINKEKEYLNSASFKKDKEFWSELYKTIPEVATIPATQKSNSSSASCSANRLSFNISKTVNDRIVNFCKKNKISAYNFFMAIFAIYIGNIANASDFVIGTPILNRLNFADKHTMGMFVSTVPFRLNLDSNYSFNVFSQDIAQKTLSMLRHQRYPYQNLLESLRKNNPSIPNLYNIVLSYQITKLSCGNLKCSSDWIFNGTSADDLQIHIIDYDNTGSLDILYDYKTEKYSSNDISILHKRINNIIEQVLNNENINIYDIDILTPDEKFKILNLLNNTVSEYPREKNIVDLFEDQVERSPDSIALIFDNQKLTYKELNEKANQLAYYMLNHGMKGKETIGILINRSVELIVGLLAILKIGATYLPIDPEYPESRIKYILENSEASAVLLHTSTINSIDSSAYNSINIDLSSDIYNSKKTNNLGKSINPNDFAYIIYTSGSTGLPKGVIISHQNLTNFIFAMKTQINFAKNKVMVSVTTISFDIFGLELWCSLASGISLVLANKFDLSSPDLLRELCIKNKIKIIQTTPSRYNNLINNSKNLDYFAEFTDILVGGEPLPQKLLTNLKNITSAKIYNVYGPTETTIWSTIKNLSNAEAITIGKPLANTTCYILNKFNNMLPINTPGELFIGGDGVCPGYWKKEDLNKSKFTLSPFKSGETIYATGDLALIDKNYELIHLGRNDFQVKIRGYRIELEEIENKILSLPSIKSCVVLSNDGKSLSCYYVSRKEYSEAELSAYLMQSLPTYMIPSSFIKLESMPLTPNGKIDRKALPKASERQDLSLASTDTEQKISKALSSILRKRQLDINTPFLNLGLDSLSIIRLQTMLLQYNIILSTQDFYQYSTIKALAEKIDNKYNSIIENDDAKIPSEFRHHGNDLDASPNFTEFSGSLNNVFLTGSNGFLGIHVLHELLTSTNNSIYCLVRGRNLDHSTRRLIEAYASYFSDDLAVLIGKRVFIITGDVDKKNFGIDISLFNSYIDKFSTIIHTAAIVKHYGDFENFKNVNINGTENVANFAYSHKKKLIHISSISVSGNYLVKQDNRNLHFSENTLYIGQDYKSNVYVNSKFQAEQIVLSYMKKGLIAQIHRIGILAGRYSDGVFQSKIFENAFYNRIRAIILLGAISDTMLTQEIEFTPVDICAKAIVKLGDNTLCDNKVYHLLDNNLLKTSSLISELKALDYNINILSATEFNKYLHSISQKHDEFLAPIINDISSTSDNLLSLNYNFTVDINSKYTQLYLKHLDFKWPIVDNTYISKLLKYMRHVKFI